jgi:hypothetical protein
MSTRAPAILLSVAAVAAFALSACATPTPPPGDGGVSPAAYPVDVVGQGTVIQTGDAPPELCLGAVALSYPPQCSGPELIGWDWAANEGSETASNVTWGTYAVVGSWDGNALTVDSAVMLALYDPAFEADPLLEESNVGASSEERLREIQDEIAGIAPVEVLSTAPQNGYLFVQVDYDDGSVQSWADQTYGPGVVAVRSALRQFAKD